MRSLIRSTAGVLVLSGAASSACSTSHPPTPTASVALPAAASATVAPPASLASSAPASPAPGVETSDEKLRRARAAAALTGTLLFSASIGDSDPHLVLYELALGGSGAPVVITKPDGAIFSGDSAPSFSPDGTKITWTRTWSITGFGIWIAGADGAGARSVENCKQFWMCSSAQLAADGNVYYAGGSLTGGPLVNIKVAPQGARAGDGRNRHWAGDDQTCEFGAFRLSPDGTKIVVVAGGKSSPKCTKRGIRTASATVKGVLGAPLPLSVETTELSRSYAEFSRDGSRILYEGSDEWVHSAKSVDGSDDRKLIAMPRQSEDMSDPTRFAIVNDAYLVTSHEGPHAAVEPLGTTILAYPLDGGAPIAITRLYDAGGFAWKP